MIPFHKTTRTTLALLVTVAFCGHLPATAQETALLPVTQATPGAIVATPISDKKPDDMVGPVVMGNMPVLQVLDLLRDFSGRVIIPGEKLPATKLNFNSGGKLERSEAIAAVENILALNGISLRMQENGFVTAILSTNPARSGAPMIDEIPEGVSSEQIYTKAFKLNFFDSSTAFYRIRNLLSASNRSHIEHSPETNVVTVTDTLNNLRRVQKVLGFLDQPQPSRHELYTFPVVHGSAWGIRTNLYQIFRSELNNRLRGSLVYVDTRTNSLLVVTHPSNFKFFEQAVADMDQPVAPFTTSEMIKIKEGNFWRIWSTLNGIVRHQQSQFSRRGFRSEEEREVEAGSSTRLSTGGERETSGETGEASVEESSVAPAVPPEPGSDPTIVMVEDTSPELQFSPYIGLFADPSNNSFVVYGTDSDIERIRRLVEQLDVKSPPYVVTEVFEVAHARASDIRNVIEYTVNIQRRNFAREGIQSGTPRGESDERPAADDGAEAAAGFEYSNFMATVADNRRNTILVQGTRQDITQVTDLIQKLDVESAPLTSNEIIYLEHAEAGMLARVIQNIINQQRYLFARNRDRSQIEAASGEGVSSPEMGFEFSDYAVVNADRRTNALFVYGTRRDIERVKEMVGETDIAVEPVTTTKVFSLTHTDATQTAGLINRVIRGQQNSLRQVRSESRGVANPAATEDGSAPASSGEGNAGIVAGDEALQFSNFISINPDRRSNSIIVYGTRSDVSQIEKLLTQIDIEVAPLTTSKVFLLENTQARSLFGVLNSVVRGQERALRQVRSSIREIRNVRGDDPDAIAAETTLEALQFSPYVTITPNDRNNSIIIYGTDSDIAQLESLIEISDVEIAPKTQSRTYFIRHADANDIATTVRSLIQQQQRVRERERTLTRVFRRDGMEGEGGEGSGGDGMDEMPDPSLLSESTSTAYNDLFSFDEDLQFSPYVSIVADDRSNAVLAYGTAFDLEQVSALIEQIDNVLPQVRIEVVIAEVILSDDQISGLETFGVSYNITSPNQTSIEANSPALGTGNQGPAFDTNFTLNDFSLDAVFGVAKSNNNVKVLSAPAITTSHNRLASINVGESRPIITSSATNLNTNDLVTRSTIEFRDIGITLKVRPLVSENGFIQLDLEQVVETVIDTQMIDGNVQPIIGSRRASSFVSVRNKEVIVMGGLQAVDSSEREGEVFALGKIPVFGSLFRPRSSSTTVRELIIFIRPQLVESMADSEIITRSHLNNSPIGEDVGTYIEKGQFPDQTEMRERLMPPVEEEESPSAGERNVRSRGTREPKAGMIPAVPTSEEETP